MKQPKRSLFLSVAAPVLLILSLLLCGMGLSLMANEYSGDELAVSLSSQESDGGFALALTLENRADYSLHNVSYRFTVPDGLSAASSDLAKLVGTLEAGAKFETTLTVTEGSSPNGQPPVTDTPNNGGNDGNTPGGNTPGGNTPDGNTPDGNTPDSDPTDELNPPANETSPLGMILAIAGGVLLVAAVIVTALLLYRKKKASSTLSMIAILLCGITFFSVGSFADDALQTATATCEVAGKTVTVEVTYAPQLPVEQGAVKVEDGNIELKDATIYIDSASEFSIVQRAADDLVNDFEMVTGNAPDLKNSLSELGDRAVIVGTVGNSVLIDSLISAGILDVSDIESKWEGYTIGVYKNLTEDLKEAVVIAGSDARGTIYGIYELSEQIGVSPWYWWADVPVEENENPTLAVEALTQTEIPDVKFRGIFINDEENFTFWSEKFENSTKAPGTKTYALVFELLLRLKANTLWPAMHNLTDAFNAVVNPETGIAYNAELANEYGIVMGSSHCELMLCNNETEWEPWCNKNQRKYNITKINNSWKDSYDYTINAEAMNAYWEDRVAQNYRFENVYTLGLRGVHDASINCSALTDKSLANRTKVVQSAIDAQMAIIEKYEQKYFEETGIRKEFVTTYCPYKEAADYYKQGLTLPEDCVILFCDDNYSYVRQFPTDAEKDIYGGFGVYYHVSYYGVPRSYLWIDSTPLSQIYNEMHKAYMAGSDDMWILNVGDIKPAEMSTDFFMKLAWDDSDFNTENLDDYMADFFTETYTIGDKDAETLAAAMTEFYQLAYPYKADYQGYNEGTEYSLVELGDEAERVIDRMTAIFETSSGIYNKLPANEKDSYYQVVHYKIRSTLLTLQKNVYEQKNKLYLSQGRFASVNAYAKLSEDAYNTIMSDIAYYNSLSGGKWDKIMNPYQTAQWLPVISGAPSVTYLPADAAEDGIGALVEGQSGGASAVTLYFSNLNDEARFLDIFSKGTKAYDYTITTDSFIVLEDAAGKKISGKTSGGKTTYTGSVEVEKRLFLTVDWSKVSKTTTGSVTVTDKYGFSRTFTVKATVASVDPSKQSTKGYYELNGLVSMEAEHFTKHVTNGDYSWKVVNNLGYAGDAMTVTYKGASNGPRVDSNYAENGAYLEYAIYFETAGKYNGTFYRIPTLNEGTGNTCRTGYALDDGTVNLLRGNSVVDTGGSSTWSNSVRCNMEKMTFTVNVPSAGWHTFRIYQVDVGITFDKIVLRHESIGSITTRTGDTETFNTVAGYTQPLRTTPPAIALKDVPFPVVDGGDNYLYDFTSDSSNATEGYLAVDLSTDASKGARYAWTEGFASIKAARRTGDKISTRDGGILYSSAKATFEVSLRRSGSYMVTIAVGDRSGSGTSASNMKVTANGKVVLTGIKQAAGGTSEYAFIVDAKDKVISLTFEGNWVISAIEIIPGEEKASGSGKFTANANGDIVIETETALENSQFASVNASKDGKNVIWMKTGGLSGYAMYFGPNTNASYSSTDPNGTQTSKMSFVIDAKAGTYNVWALVKSAEDDDDSVIIALDDGQVQTANDFKNTGGTYVWKKVGSVKISADGESTLTVWGREDGLCIDKIVLTAKSTAPAIDAPMKRS